MNKLEAKILSQNNKKAKLQEQKKQLDEKIRKIDLSLKPLLALKKECDEISEKERQLEEKIRQQLTGKEQP